MSAVLSARDLVKRYGARRVLDRVSLSASPGHRLGLIGENGAGKTTLLRLLAGQLEPDGGSVTRPDEVGFLPQEPPDPDHATVGEVVDRALAGIRSAERRLAELADRLQREPDDPAALAGYGETLQWAVDHDLWDADRRAELVLAGLGLHAAGRDRPVGTLSGGERSRLGLAALLIRQPRALLLDEPTNHLDDAAIEFVEGHLARLPGAVVLASHDRVFLDAACTALLDLDPAASRRSAAKPAVIAAVPGPGVRGGVTYYGGGYSDYLRAKRVERQRWEEQYAAEQQQLHQLRQAVRITSRQVAHDRPRRDGDKMAYDFHGGRVQSQISRRIRNAQRRLDELTRDQVRKPPAPLTFRPPLAGNGHRSGLAVSLREVRVPGRLLVDQLDLPAAGRLLLVGPNGSGKSTLLAVLAGRLAPVAGTVSRRRGLRVGLLAQEGTFSEPDRTARQVYQAGAPGARVGLAELGLLAPRELDQPVGQLSTGQRRRLALAVLVAGAPDLLLLDEPTNHISLALAEELEQALRTAPGAVVVASHDRWLRRAWDGPWLRITTDHRVIPDPVPHHRGAVRAETPGR